MRRQSYEYHIDLGDADGVHIGVPDWVTYGSFQAVSDGADPSTMTLAVKRALVPDPSARVDFASAVTIDPSTRAIVGPIDLRDTQHLFIEPASTQAGKRCRLVVLFTDRE